MLPPLTTDQQAGILRQTGGAFSSRMGNTDVSGAGQQKQASKEILDNIISKFQNITNVNATIKSGAYDSFGNNFLTRGAMGLMDSFTGLLDQQDEEVKKKSEIQLVVEAIESQKQYLIQIKEALTSLPSNISRDDANNTLCQCEEQLDKILIAVEKPLELNLNSTNNILSEMQKTLTQVVDELELIDVDIKDLKVLSPQDDATPRKSKRKMIDVSDVRTKTSSNASRDEDFFTKREKQLNDVLRTFGKGKDDDSALTKVVSDLVDAQNQTEEFLEKTFPDNVLHPDNFTQPIKRTADTLEKIREIQEKQLELSEHSERDPISNQESKLEENLSGRLSITEQRNNTHKSNKLAEMMSKSFGGDMLKMGLLEIGGLIASAYVAFKSLISPVLSAMSGFLGKFPLLNKVFGATPTIEKAATSPSGIAGAKSVAGKIVGKAAIGLGAIGAWQDVSSAQKDLESGKISENEFNKKGGEAVGGLAGSMAGAKLGAMLGTAGGPVGTILGGLIGGVGGYFGGSKLGETVGGLFGEEKRKNEAIEPTIGKSVTDQQQQIDTLKKQVEELKDSLKKKQSQETVAGQTNIITNNSNSNVVLPQRQPTKNTESSFNRYLGTVFVA